MGARDSGAGIAGYHCANPKGKAGAEHVHWPLCEHVRSNGAIADDLLFTFFVRACVRACAGRGKGGR